MIMLDSPPWGNGQVSIKTPRNMSSNHILWKSGQIKERGAANLLFAVEVVGAAVLRSIAVAHEGHISVGRGTQRCVGSGVTVFKVYGQSHFVSK